MVIPTDIQASFVMAALFADMGRTYILAESRASPARSQLAYHFVRKWALLNVGVFLALTIVVFYCAWPAWEVQYWVPWAEELAGSPLRSLLAGLYLIALSLAALLGSWLGFRWIVLGHIGRLRAVYLSVLVVTVGIFLARWPGPIVLGSYSGFMAGAHELPNIWDDGWFLTMLCVLLAYTGMPIILVYLGFRRRYRQSSLSAA